MQRVCLASCPACLPMSTWTFSLKSWAPSLAPSAHCVLALSPTSVTQCMPIYCGGACKWTDARLRPTWLPGIQRTRYEYMLLPPHSSHTLWCCGILWYIALESCILFYRVFETVLLCELSWPKWAVQLCRSGWLLPLPSRCWGLKGMHNMLGFYFLTPLFGLQHLPLWVKQSFLF